MPRVLVTFLIGGVTGWASNQAYNYVAKKNKQKGIEKYDLQKKMSSQWSRNYEPVAWDYDWDGRDKAFKELRNAEKLEKAKLKSNEMDKTNKRDVNNNYINNNISNSGNNTGNNKPKKLGNASRNMLLIRHGQYNTAGDEDQNHTLTKNGIEQSIATGKQLKETKLPFTHLIVSTMTRAQQTADLVQTQLTALPIQRSATNLLREGAPFPPEPPLHNWKPDSKQFLEDGSRIEESFKSFFHRADLDQTQDSYEIVVCHANVIRYIVCRALQLPPEAWLRMSLQHASVTWLTIRPSGRVTLRCYGDGGHIPLPLKTFT